MGTAEKVSKVRGQRSRSSPDPSAYDGGSMHFDSVVSGFTYLYFVAFYICIYFSGHDSIGSINIAPATCSIGEFMCVLRSDHCEHIG